MGHGATGPGYKLKQIRLGRPRSTNCFQRHIGAFRHFWTVCQLVTEFSDPVLCTASAWHGSRGGYVCLSVQIYVAYLRLEGEHTDRWHAFYGELAQAKALFTHVSFHFLLIRRRRCGDRCCCSGALSFLSRKGARIGVTPAM